VQWHPARGEAPAGRQQQTSLVTHSHPASTTDAASGAQLRDDEGTALLCRGQCWWFAEHATQYTHVVQPCASINPPDAQGTMPSPQHMHPRMSTMVSSGAMALMLGCPR
jgi:hypothetical protein